MENARFTRTAVKRRTAQARPGAGPSRCSSASCRAALPEVAGYEFWRPLQAGPGGRRRLLRLHPAAEGRLAVALGDVAGKGVPAALLMAKLSSDTRFCCPDRADAGRGRRQAQRPALRVHQPDATASSPWRWSVLDPAHAHGDAGQRRASRRRCCIAGRWTRCEEVVSNEDGRVAAGDRGGLLVRIVPDRSWSRATSLLIFTDGVTDSLDAERQAVRRRRVSRPPLEPGGPADT